MVCPSTRLSCRSISRPGAARGSPSQGHIVLRHPCASACHLVFRQAERSDAPFAQTGRVSVPHQSGAIYLVTIWHGQYRLVVLGRPTIAGEMYGVLTTLHAGRGSQLTPVAAPIALIPEARLAQAMPYGRITPGMPKHAACLALLKRVGDDGFAAFFPCPN